MVDSLCWAVFGVLLEGFYNGKYKERISLGLYVALGWSALICVYDLYQALGWEGFAWMAMGGLSYMLGVPFYVLEAHNEYMHVIWHLFVNAGAVLHWYLIYRFLILDVCRAD